MKYKTIMISFFLLILFSISAIGGRDVVAGNDIVLDTIAKCYGDVMVNIDAEVSINVEHFSFIGCDYDNNGTTWLCPCQPMDTQIILRTEPEYYDVYDVAIEYMLEHVPKGEQYDNVRYDATRTKQFSNIEVIAKKDVPPKKKESKPFEMPKFDNMFLVLGIIIGLIAIIGFGLYYAFKMFMKMGGDDDDF